MVRTYLKLHSFEIGPYVRRRDGLRARQGQWMLSTESEQHFKVLPGKQLIVFEWSSLEDPRLGQYRRGKVEIPFNTILRINLEKRMQNTTILILELSKPPILHEGDQYWNIERKRRAGCKWVKSMTDDPDLAEAANKYRFHLAYIGNSLEKIQRELGPFLVDYGKVSQDPTFLPENLPPIERQKFQETSTTKRRKLEQGRDELQVHPLQTQPSSLRQVHGLPTAQWTPTPTALYSPHGFLPGSVGQYALSGNEQHEKSKKRPLTTISSADNILGLSEHELYGETDSTHNTTHQNNNINDNNQDDRNNSENFRQGANVSLGREQGDFIISLEGMKASEAKAALEFLSVVELKRQLRLRSLPKSGRKSELVARLLDFEFQFPTSRGFELARNVPLSLQEEIPPHDFLIVGDSITPQPPERVQFNDPDLLRMDFSFAMPVPRYVERSESNQLDKQGNKDQGEEEAQENEKETGDEVTLTVRAHVARPIIENYENITFSAPAASRHFEVFHRSSAWINDATRNHSLLLVNKVELNFYLRNHKHLFDYPQGEGSRCDICNRSVESFDLSERNQFHNWLCNELNFNPRHCIESKISWTGRLDRDSPGAFRVCPNGHVTYTFVERVENPPEQDDQEQQQQHSTEDNRENCKQM